MSGRHSKSRLSRAEARQAFLEDREFASIMLISNGHFFLLRSQDQVVIPIRMTDTTIQITKQDVGNGPAFVIILAKAITPVMTTMMVSARGILRDGFKFAFLS